MDSASVRGFRHTLVDVQGQQPFFLLLTSAGLARCLLGGARGAPPIATLARLPGSNCCLTFPTFSDMMTSLHITGHPSTVQQLTMNSVTTRMTSLPITGHCCCCNRTTHCEHRKTRNRHSSSRICGNEKPIGICACEVRSPALHHGFYRRAWILS
jgi:hypothetical protein